MGKRPFYQTLLILFGVLMGIGLICLTILWAFLSGFQSSSGFLTEPGAASSTVSVDSTLDTSASEPVLDHEVEIQAPRGVDVFVDGSGLEPESSTRPSPLFDGVDSEELEELIPSVQRYQLQTAGEPDEISAQKNGRDCVVIQDILTGTYYASRPIIRDSELEEYEEALTKAAQTYARYISRDAAFSEIARLLCQKTEFYERFRRFDNQWFSNHESYDFLDFTIEGIQSFSENDFTGIVSFDYEIVSGNIKEVTPCVYQITFLKAGGNWLVADMKIA